MFPDTLGKFRNLGDKSTIFKKEEGSMRYQGFTNVGFRTHGIPGSPITMAAIQASPAIAYSASPTIIEFNLSRFEKDQASGLIVRLRAPAGKMTMVVTGYEIVSSLPDLVVVTGYLTENADFPGAQPLEYDISADPATPDMLTCPGAPAGSRVKAILNLGRQEGEIVSYINSLDDEICLCSYASVDPIMGIANQPAIPPVCVNTVII